MTVLQLPARGDWLADARDGDRALRVTWHAEEGCVVLSTWRDGACVGTVRLSRTEAARLVGVLADGLARTDDSVAGGGPGDRAVGAP